MAKQYGASSSSGQTMEERIAEENAIKEKRQKKIRILISFILLIVGIVVVVVNVVRSSSLKEEIKTLNEQAKDATAEVEGLRQRSSTREQKTIEVKEQLYSADQLAAKLCNVQNKLNEMFSEKGIESYSDEDRTKVVEEMHSYISTGDNQLWCDRGTWYSNTNFSVGDSYPVVFTCYDDKNDPKHEKLLAYVIATYDAKDNVFAGVSLSTTSWVDAYDQRTEPVAGPDDPVDPDDPNPSGEPADGPSDDPGQHLQDIIDDYDRSQPSETPTEEEVTKEEEAHG